MPLRNAGIRANELETNRRRQHSGATAGSLGAADCCRCCGDAGRQTGVTQAAVARGGDGRGCAHTQLGSPAADARGGGRTQRDTRGPAAAAAQPETAGEPPAEMTGLKGLAPFSCGSSPRHGRSRTCCASTAAQRLHAGLSRRAPGCHPCGGGRPGPRSSGALMCAPGTPNGRALHQHAQAEAAAARGQPGTAAAGRLARASPQHAPLLC